jgi:hypothetical protein
VRRREGTKEKKREKEERKKEKRGRKVADSKRE